MPLSSTTYSHHVESDGLLQFQTCALLVLGSVPTLLMYVDQDCLPTGYSAQMGLGPVNRTQTMCGLLPVPQNPVHHAYVTIIQSPRMPPPPGRSCP